MENNLNSQRNEFMLDLELPALRREIDNTRLLRDAGLSRPGWIARFLKTVGSSLARSGKKPHEHYTKPRQAHQATSGKLAS